MKIYVKVYLLHLFFRAVLIQEGKNILSKLSAMSRKKSKLLSLLICRWPLFEKEHSYSERRHNFLFIGTFNTCFCKTLVMKYMEYLIFTLHLYEILSYAIVTIFNYKFVAPCYQVEAIEIFKAEFWNLIRILKLCRLLYNLLHRSHRLPN